MSHYIKTLNDAVIADRQLEAERTIINRAADAQAARDHLRPLTLRLRVLLDHLPDETKRAGLSLPTLRPMLRGRRGRGCSSAELGDALRALGYTRRRGWGAGSGNGFGSSWFPPGTV